MTGEHPTHPGAARELDHIHRVLLHTLEEDNKRLRALLGTIVGCWERQAESDRNIIEHVKAELER